MPVWENSVREACQNLVYEKRLAREVNTLIPSLRTTDSGQECDMTAGRCSCRRSSVNSNYIEVAQSDVNCTLPFGCMIIGKILASTGGKTVWACGASQSGSIMRWSRPSSDTLIFAIGPFAMPQTGDRTESTRRWPVAARSARKERPWRTVRRSRSTDCRATERGSRNTQANGQKRAGIDRRAIKQGTARNGQRVANLTEHKAKGTQADYVVLLDTGSPRVGENAGNRALKRVLSAFRRTNTAAEEERRIWYVALTRAKRMVYVIVATGIDSHNEFTDAG